MHELETDPIPRIRQKESKAGNKHAGRQRSNSLTAYVTYSTINQQGLYKSDTGRLRGKVIL